MKTSMAYRMYRLYFNSNADNHKLFGNRVHNPINGTSASDKKEANVAALVRLGLIIAATVATVLIVS